MSPSTPIHPSAARLLMDAAALISPAHAAVLAAVLVVALVVATVALVARS